jgi:GH15 family glucan-1,4-alpha-glucosidase
VTDWVDAYLPVWARTVRISLPPGSGPGVVGVYSVQAYALGENTIGEEAVFDPDVRRLYHFKGPLWVAVQVRRHPSRVSGDGTDPPATPASLRATVAKVRDGGVRFSPETGLIDGPQVDHGLVQSALGFAWEDGRIATAEYLLAFGRDRPEADRNLDVAGDAGAIAARSQRYWSRWRISAPASVSVKVLAAHCDSGGGVVASCDGDILGDYRDHYRYVWPRDAAMCASALLRAGLPGYARRYLGFCSRTVSDGGFFFQRYRTDGTLGSGWHPWRLPPAELPVQEDETALPLVAAADYLDATGDVDALNGAYERFVRKAARFILDYTAEGGTLVRPSHDLWEERRGIFAFTQASCVAGLLGAGKVAEALGRRSDSGDFRDGAASLLSGLALHLSDEDRGYCRGITRISDGGPRFERDWTADASLFLVPLLLPSPAAPGGPWEAAHDRLLAVTWERSSRTWARIRDSLAVTVPGGDVPGYARYEGDWYFRPGGAQGLPGNPWLVTTAWFVLSGYRLGLLRREDARKYLRWFEAAALPVGIMPEEVSCLSGAPLSVSPLAWSHAMHLELLSALETPAVALNTLGEGLIRVRGTGQNKRDTPGGG